MAVESAAGPESDGVTVRPEILSDRVKGDIEIPRSALGGHSHDGGGTGDLSGIGVLQLAFGGHNPAEKGSRLLGRQSLLHLSVEACLDGRRIVAINRLNEFVGRLGERRAEAGADASAAASVMSSPAILPEGFQGDFEIPSSASAVTRTMAVGPVTCVVPLPLTCLWRLQVPGKREWPCRAETPAAFSVVACLNGARRVIAVDGLDQFLRGFEEAVGVVVGGPENGSQ